MSGVRIPKTKWEQLANQHANNDLVEMAQILAAYEMTPRERTAVLCLFEQAVFAGMTLVEEMRRDGHDTSESFGLTPTLLRKWYDKHEKTKQE